MSEVSATPEQKRRARKLVSRAVAAGRIQPMPCEQCGAIKAQAHHDDYSKPLVVRWLCGKCHSVLHNQKHPLTSNCVVCEKEFTPKPTKRARQLTCSPTCFLKLEHKQHLKITLDDMRAIRQRYQAGGITQQQLADEYRIDRTRVSQIVRGKASRISEINRAI